MIGRKAPSTKPDASAEELNPPAYRMKIFAQNEVIAKSRFWYFMHQMRKMKKTTGEILDVNEIVEKNDRYIKNYGIWIKYNSRSGTHNMYREYRANSLNKAVETLYDDMAGRHRARSKSIQIIRTAVVADQDCKRTGVTQFHRTKDAQLNRVDVKFPLPHRILRAPTKAVKSTFSVLSPNTHFQ